MQLHLQIESLTAGQKLLAAKPPSALIPAAGTESPRLKVTSWRKIPALYAQLRGPSSSQQLGGDGRQERSALGSSELQPTAPGWDHCYTSSFWKLRGSSGMCRSTLLTSPAHSACCALSPAAALLGKHGWERAGVGGFAPFSSTSSG